MEPLGGRVLHSLGEAHRSYTKQDVYQRDQIPPLVNRIEKFVFYAISLLSVKAINTKPYKDPDLILLVTMPEMTYLTFLTLILVSVTLGAPKAHEKRVTSSKTSIKPLCSGSIICTQAESDCGELFGG